MIEISEDISKIFEIAFKPIIFILSLFSFKFSILWSCFFFSSTSIQASEKLPLLSEYSLRPKKLSFKEKKPPSQALTTLVF